MYYWWGYLFYFFFDQFIHFCFNWENPNRKLSKFEFEFEFVFRCFYTKKLQNIVIWYVIHNKNYSVTKNVLYFHLYFFLNLLKKTSKRRIFDNVYLHFYQKSKKRSAKIKRCRPIISPISVRYRWMWMATAGAKRADITGKTSWSKLFQLR